MPNYVTVTDQAAWDEQVPTYGYSERCICNTCGADCTGNEAAHGKQHMMNGQNAGYHTEVIQTITGYSTVHHDAVTHVEDQGHAPLSQARQQVSGSVRRPDRLGNRRIPWRRRT